MSGIWIDLSDGAAAGDGVAEARSQCSLCRRGVAVSSPERTAPAVDISGELWGASVGDSGALLVTPDGPIELTAAQSRKPLAGSGACRPAIIPRQPLSRRLLVATDGLLKYTSLATINALARTGDVKSAVEALIQAAALRSGNLQDDVAVVLGERVG